ncbi:MULTISPECIES: MFS transporter [Desulfococcus]|jgi:MFS family permease|uniref:Major facilitator superfamily MFS_1 n=1 Tax=Desulfococcus multivorans DSM 2059 TaxID=1121405 RepID=S7U2R1_DESML|nr:MFS transporter [Desulfococcus multivorans]AOY58478.1 major facilitator superfamily MFS1 permease protein [Desulfococcus multivorans]AQV00793.1 MFS transporter [Desulfococcus multivorans]EPR43265.1 major facilitator superfamily MFS_1 [Desulfococcus multivorans DSM 2059]MDX9817290.1 MFS transporter [Desulfococcus multivorans]SJZ41581.1 Major Facilitator Superfamily protein [Desulfococcus multivorans DSM 2059]
MVSTFVPFTALFAAVLILMAGVGLLNTLLSLKLTLAGFAPQTIGGIMACYFVGLILGSVQGHRLIERVGHIRAFAVFAAVTTGMVMLHGLFVSAALWALLRLLTGISIIGLYMVIESWLNECTEPRTRGRIFSVYMIMSYLGMAVGQQLLNMGNVATQELFFLVGFLVTFSLVPVAATHAIHPELPSAQHYRILPYFKRAPIGMLGSLSAGMINSAFYAMGPVFGHQIHLTVSELSAFMTATILGGLAFQWPVGIISDRFDRTLVLPLLGVMVAGAALLVIVVAEITYWLMIGVMAMFGGLIFAVYPVAVARAHDLFERKDIVPVSSCLLFSYGIGAAVGPVGASTVMTWAESPYGFMGYIAMIAGIYAVVTWVLRRIEKVEIVPVADQVGFLAMESTSPMAVQLDPRAEIDSKGL